MGTLILLLSLILLWVVQHPFHCKHSNTEETGQCILLIDRNFLQPEVNYKILAPIFANQMKRSQHIFSTGHIGTSLFMMVALLWLTVSTPFVYNAQRAIEKEIQKQSSQAEDTNPFSNTTEEKNESSVNTLSEYLHDHPSLEKNFTLVTRLYKRYPSSIYCEHHPELLSPPPEA
jgi:hypothetical protein